MFNITIDANGVEYKHAQDLINHIIDGDAVVFRRVCNLTLSEEYNSDEFYADNCVYYSMYGQPDCKLEFDAEIDVVTLAKICFPIYDELRAENEELRKVNDELKTKNEELNEDLNNTLKAYDELGAKHMVVKNKVEQLAVKLANLEDLNDTLLVKNKEFSDLNSNHRLTLTMLERSVGALERALKKAKEDNGNKSRQISKLREVNDNLRTENDELLMREFKRLFDEESKAAKSKRHIEKIIFNGPATIIIFNDGSKTVVKCSEGDVYDPEKGLAMALCKSTYTGNGHYYDIFKDNIPAKEDK